MISAEALAGPGLLALLIAIPVCCVLSALGRRGAVLATGLMAIVGGCNFLIANQVSEFGEFGAGVTLAVVFFSPILFLIGGHLGSFLRQRAQAKRDAARLGAS